MRPAPVRVVYDYQPYLVTRREDGSIGHAFGPFTPGTEPSLDECSAEREIHDPVLLATLTDLLPISPLLPASDDNLAGTA